VAERSVGQFCGEPTDPGAAVERRRSFGSRPVDESPTLLVRNGEFVDEALAVVQSTRYDVRGFEPDDPVDADPADASGYLRSTVRRRC